MLFFFFVFSFAISKPSRRLTRHALVPLITSGHPVN